jgi:hypothetical protein
MESGLFKLLVIHTQLKVNLNRKGKEGLAIKLAEE